MSKKSKKEEKEQERTNISEKVNVMTENQILSNLETVKDQICNKVKQLDDLIRQKKEVNDGYKDAINVLKDDLDEQLYFKLELENRIRILDNEEKAGLTVVS